MEPAEGLQPLAPPMPQLEQLEGLQPVAQPMTQLERQLDGLQPVALALVCTGDANIHKRCQVHSAGGVVNNAIKQADQIRNR